jgi:hypothetical protein
LRRVAVDSAGSPVNSRQVIDVVPVADGVWLARCECGATERFSDPEAGWAWVLGHPCPEDPEDAVIDLTEPRGCNQS